MCGRYCLYDDDNEELRAILDKTEGEFKTGEIFPTDRAPILIQQNESTCVPTSGFSSVVWMPICAIFVSPL